MKRENNIYPKLISDDNLRLAIIEVNRTHRWRKHHRPNKTVEWVENDIDARIIELRTLIEEGFTPSPVKMRNRYDRSAGKWREINEPKLWPDQYIHHALIQVLQPAFLRRMDKFCCGSIKGRGPHYGKRYIEKWMHTDVRGTKYCAELDIRHFYQSLQPEVVMARMRKLIKDYRVLDLIWRIIADGVRIGFYTSQWLANVTLQPLDKLIRTSENKAAHYIRYMDNFTIFHSNKRKLRRLVKEVEEWLNSHGLELKGNWQVFPTRSRMPNALGFRYGRGYTLLRKKTLLRIKRSVTHCYRRLDAGKSISPKQANDVLSSIGGFKHWNSRNVRDRYVRNGVQRTLKSVVRKHSRKEMMKWSMCSDLSKGAEGRLKTSKQ